MKKIPAWRREATALRWEQQGGMCHYCAVKMRQTGNSPARMTLDHINPKSSGGANDLDNLVGCCRACNEAKGNMGLKKWDKLLTARAGDCLGN